MVSVSVLLCGCWSGDLVAEDGGKPAYVGIQGDSSKSETWKCYDCRFELLFFALAEAGLRPTRPTDTNYLLIKSEQKQQSH